MKEFGLNPLHYVSLPDYSFDCGLMSNGVTLDKLQDKQMLDDFVEENKGFLCGIMRDRYINNGNANANANAHSKNRTIRYIDANNLYGYAVMQKLPYKDFEYSVTSLDTGETTLQRIL